MRRQKGKEFSLTELLEREQQRQLRLQEAPPDPRDKWSAHHARKVREFQQRWQKFWKDEWLEVLKGLELSHIRMYFDQRIENSTMEKTRTLDLDWQLLRTVYRLEFRCEPKFDLLKGFAEVRSSVILRSNANFDRTSRNLLL